MARRNSVRAVARKALAFEGMDEFQERLAKIVDETTGKEIKDVLMGPAILIRDDARRRVRSKTGKLVKAIFAARGDENKPSVIVGVNFKIAPHAHLTEFGHGGPRPAPPHPYMRPAIDTNSTRSIQMMKDGFTKIIERNAK